MFKHQSVHTRTVNILVTYTIFLLAVIVLNFFVGRYIVALPLDEEPIIFNYMVIADILMFVLATAIAIPMAAAARKYVSLPIQNMNRAMKQLAVGNTNIEFQHRNTDEVGQLSDSFREIIASIKYEDAVLDRLAGGDFSANVVLRGAEDDMFSAIRGIISQNISVLTDIQKIAGQVYNAAAQLSNGAQNLASGSSEQTATLEQFTSVIEQVQLQAEDNVFKSGAMLVTIEENMDVMERIISDMEKMTNAMDAITASSQKVASVIHVIEDIAFQTNILSLNASVEAARAGNNGRGFAVVADEVKELASKSAEAAQETAALIQSNISTVEAGNKIVEATKTSVTDIERMTKATQKNMGELNDDSISQSAAISDITVKIGQLTSVVQSNSAMAEEYSASAEELTAQSEQLTTMVGRFKISN
ncbi:MAG: methyl-accepting chemotaxis protein [Clostridiales Family XIII bacterium]|jgi:methyl-accepting chemotaxis protein|nr:methyl-accepting chemotaxis protein [Clostridiales Family XIII bacterium]